MANDEWRASVAQVEYLEFIESGHRLAIIKIRKRTEQGRRCFQFDTRLCQNPDFKRVVKNGWDNGSSTRNISVSERIRKCRHVISNWRKTTNSNSVKLIKELIAKIDSAQTNPLIPTEKIYEMNKELLQAYTNEKTYWKGKKHESMATKRRS